MAETKLKIDVYRNKSIDELTKLLADPESKLDTGSAAAATAALAASLLCRASAICLTTNPENDQLQWYVRNSEILRAYMVNLVDEEVKSRAPLRRAIKEDDPVRIEASRQAAVCICSEVVNMMTKCLEMIEGLLSYANSTTAFYLVESADIAIAASKMCVPYILHMGSYSTDSTYQYVLKRENELTAETQVEIYNRILNRTEG